MVWMAAAAVGLGILGAASNKKASKDAQRASERAGRLNYSNIMAETTESIRRAEMQQEQAYGSSVAGIGGSGVRQSGSAQGSLDAMQAEFTRQNEWTQDAGERRAQIALETGQDIGQQYENQGNAQLFSQASNMFQNQWWNMSNTTGAA